jgi:hypothetical protein
VDKKIKPMRLYSQKQQRHEDKGSVKGSVPGRGVKQGTCLNGSLPLSDSLSTASCGAAPDSPNHANVSASALCVGRCQKSQVSQ